MIVYNEINQELETQTNAQLLKLTVALWALHLKNLPVLLHYQSRCNKYKSIENTKILILPLDFHGLGWIL